MTQISLADRAANFVLEFTDNQHADKRAIATLLFEAANEIAVGAGYDNFTELGERTNVMAIARATSASREAYEGALRSGLADVAGALAAVHLMCLKLVDGLEDVQTADQIAELAAYLYSQEFAHRQITKRTH